MGRKKEKKNTVANILTILALIACLVFAFWRYSLISEDTELTVEGSGDNIQAMFGVSNVINLALWLCFSFGLMFQVPLVTNMLIKCGILSYEAVSLKRPYVVISILILAALLTPPDIISQILLFTPTYLLFELGLLLSKKDK